MASPTSYSGEDDENKASPTLYSGEDDENKASPTLYSGEDDETKASPTPYNGEDGESMASPTPYSREDGESMASPPLYGAGDELLFGVDSVLCFAIFTIQEVRVAVAVDRVDGIGYAVAGAEDVWCGLETGLILVDEDGLVAIATTTGDFGVTEIRGEK